MLGKIISIQEVRGVQLGNRNGRLGLSRMKYFCVYSSMDGYKVVTDKHIYHVLIDNVQSCCETWGYLSSEDDFEQFIGSELIEVKLTDTALNQTVVANSGYYEGRGGIQFVDFITTVGVLQLAVYNGHNGYYGHEIIVAKDEEILLEDTL